MLIRDLEIKTGLDRATIRYYEKEGLITPERSENGYRNYTDENLNSLLKIKLLRQLGMSLDRIHALQQGSVDLQAVLTEQIQVLERKIKDAEQAKAVCLQMKSDRVSYGNLDVSHYLNAFNTPQTVSVSKTFKERVSRPYHPFRRFLARWIDYTLAGNLIQFLLIVLLKVRPYSNLHANMVTFLTPFLMVPLVALMLHCWGTTPGKWCLGLQIESEDGGNLNFSSALQREWDVLRYGYGFGIPLWIYFCLYKSYRTYQERDPDWDWESEYNYRPRSKKRSCGLVGLILVIALLIATSTSFQFQPKYRGDLTVAEFSANYNHFKTMLYSEYDGLQQLQRDGTYIPEPHVATLYMDGTPVKERYSFDYVKEGEKLKEIQYQNTWHDIFSLDPIGIHCDLAAITAVMSQEGMGIESLWNFVELWNTESNLETGDIQYGKVRIYWMIESKNCKRTVDGLYFSSDDSKDSAVTLNLTIALP